MPTLLVFGNSGAGKSTFAKRVSTGSGCAHLDLDTIAWDPEAATPTRLPLEDSQRQIEAFVEANRDWVIEGCYADLLELAMSSASEVVFLDPGASTCRDNARKRPFEPHKYASPEAQDANLSMLLDWIDQYYDREDEFSHRAHLALYERFPGKKQRLTSNAREGDSG